MNLERRLARIRRVELEYGQELGAESVEFGGICNFLLCPEFGPHIHYICPECGAVKFGNIFCATCGGKHDRLRQEIDAESKEAG